MKNDTKLKSLYIGLTAGLCGSFSTWSMWNQQLSLLFVGEVESESTNQVILWVQFRLTLNIHLRCASKLEPPSEAVWKSIMFSVVAIFKCVRLSKFTDGVFPFLRDPENELSVKEVTFLHDKTACFKALRTK